MHEFFRFPAPGQTGGVEYDPQAVEDLRKRAVDASIAVRRLGIGIGGLLIGTSRAGGNVRIMGFQEIECTHSLGPSFALNDAEMQAVRAKLSDPSTLRAVGLFITKPRGPLELTDNQRALFRELFTEQNTVVLLMRPGALEPSRVAVYLNSGAGLVRGEEFDLEPWSATGETNQGFDPGDSDPSEEAPPKMLSYSSLAAQRQPWTSPPPATAKPGSFSPAPISVKMMREPSVAPEPAVASAVAEPPTTAVPADPQPDTPSTAEYLEPSHLEQATEPPFSPSAATYSESGVAPIRVDFDESAEWARPMTPWAKAAAFIETKVFLPLRQNIHKFAKVIALVVLLAVGAALYHFSRPLWVTPPPANLVIDDKKGVATLRWNPEAAEFVDGGTITVLENGQTSTVALSRADLMKGWIVYTRTSSRIVATLALDEKRFIAAFEEKVPANR